ncbi:GMC oxidoreductase [Terrihabitans sp. B22-R8]|uniref:GMC oxidoreductase n=1 Tax=Terrihabitans sp. B22-R8 TaxID=3425128 RepID=UPI00403C7FDE
MIVAEGDGRSPHYDVCVIGSGPGGLALALECEARNLSVALVEAGTGRPRRKARPIFTADILDEERHVPLHVGARHQFGGTSTAWGGLCVPLDAIDFAVRDYVPESGWPIAHAEMMKWESAARRFLGLGDREFTSDLPLWEMQGGVDAGSLGQITATWNLAHSYGPHISRSQRIHLYSGMRVLALEADSEREIIRGLRASGQSGMRAGPKADIYVLAGGGIQTTALLLDLQAEHPLLFPPESPLGRFYMGHVTGEIATIIIGRPEEAGDLLVQLDRTGVAHQRRLRVADDVQTRMRMLNTAFTLRAAPLMNSEHGSGALSLAYIASHTAMLRGLARSRGLRSTAARRWGGMVSHLGNILRRPHVTLADTARLLWMARRGKLPILLPNPHGHYSLRYHAEQAPNRQSRIFLSAPSSGETGPRLSIDFRYCEDDARSILRAHEHFDGALRASGKGRLEYWQEPRARMDAVLSQARDGYHQIGTTRMGASPRSGVVTPDCRVHGLANLFVASSSVFPTSAAANPTFSIVCLSIRLAHHISQL